MAEQRVTIGRIVHYVREDAFGQIVERPAMVVHVWDEDGPAPGTVQLQVFNDGDGGVANDGLPNVTWETSVMYDEQKAPYTWHWPERS